MSKFNEVYSKIHIFRVGMRDSAIEALKQDLDEFFKENPEVVMVRFFWDYGSTDEGDTWDEYKVLAEFAEDRYYYDYYEYEPKGKYGSEYDNEIRQIVNTIDVALTVEGDFEIKNPYHVKEEK